MIINLFDNKKYGAFSLAEALVVMLIVSIISMVTLPIVTKKRSVSTHSLHGKWACTYFNNSYQQASASDPDHTFSEDDFSAVDECTFPLLSKAVKYLFVETYPSGGGGTRGYATPWVNKTDKKKFNEPVQYEGDYKLAFYMFPDWSGSLASAGLSASYEKLTAYETTTSSDANYHYKQLGTYYPDDETDMGSLIRKYCYDDNTNVSSATEFKKVDTTISGTASDRWVPYSYCVPLNIPKLETVKEEYFVTDEEGNQVLDEEGNPITEWREKDPVEYDVLADRNVCRSIEETGIDDAEDTSPCIILRDSHKINSPISVTSFNKQDRTVHYCYRDADYQSNPKIRHPINSLYSTNGTSLVDKSPNYYIYSSSASLHTRYVNNTANALLRECQSEICAPGKHTHCECKRDGDNVIYSFDDKECKSNGSLSVTANTSNFGGFKVVGVIPLLVGDMIQLVRDGGATHSDRMVGGYVVKGGRDPQNLTLYRIRNSESEMLFSMTGGRVATFEDSVPSSIPSTAYSGPYTYVKTGYPTTQTSDKGEIYIVQPTANDSTKTYFRGNFVLTTPYNDSILPKDTDKYYIKPFDGFDGVEAPYGQVLSISIEDFDFKYGCAGETPNRTASAYITTNRANRYTFEVGMGGQGDAGPEKSNDIFTNHRAQKGGVTRFENIMVEGGNPGSPAQSSSCSKGTTVTVGATYVINGPVSADSHIPGFGSLLGKGGFGGGVIYSDNSNMSGPLYNYKPYRDYSKSAAEDTDPGSRWSMQNAGAGTAGMIIVSW